MDNNFAEYGPIFAAPTGSITSVPRPDYPGTVFIHGPNLMHDLCADKDGYYRTALSHRLFPAEETTLRTAPLKRIMTGLAYQRGETHRLHRRLILPALHKQRVKTYLDDMVSETQALLDTWKGGQVYDMRQEMNRLILRISARSLFGRLDQAEGERIGLLIDQWIDFIMSASHLFPYDLPGFPYRKWLNLSKDIETATRQLIVSKRKSGADDDSLLSLLIQATNEDGASFSEDDLVGHISLMLWGSRDAAAAALMWALFLISLHAEVHDNVVQELDSVLSGSAPTLEQLTLLPSTERALKESMRVLPPFPIVNRVAAENQRLGGYDIPERAEVLMSIYHTHRMPELYAQPDAFRPERWQTIDPQTFEYLPFSGGPRMCPGTNFAWQELMVVTAMILQRYRLEMVDGAKVDRIVKLALLPKQGLPMIVNDQDHQFSRSAKVVRGNVNQMVSTLPE
jgi:cytochrome P450